MNKKLLLCLFLLLFTSTLFSAGWKRVDVGSCTSYINDIEIGEGRNDGINRIYGAIDWYYIYEFSWTGSSWTKVYISSDVSIREITMGNGRNDGTNRIYLNIGGAINEFTWNGYSWLQTEVGYGDSNKIIGNAKNDGVNRLYSADYMLYEFCWYGTSWTRTDSDYNHFDSFSIGNGRNDSLNRIYCSSNNIINELTWNGSSWTMVNLGYSNSNIYTLIIGKGRNDGINRIYATDINRNLYEFTWTGSSWLKNNITGNCDYDSIALGQVKNDNLNRIYSTNTGKLSEYTWTNSSWSVVNCNLDYTDYIYSTPNLNIASGRNDGMNRIYIGNPVNKHIYEISYDTISPTAITNLSAKINQNLSEIVLNWTSPSDNTNGPIINGKYKWE